MTLFAPIPSQPSYWPLRSCPHRKPSTPPPPTSPPEPGIAQAWEKCHLHIHVYTQSRVGASSLALHMTVSGDCRSPKHGSPT